MARDFAKRFYSSKRWQDCRNGYSKSVGHLCERCLRLGIYRPGVIVHHKIEIDPVTINHPEIALNWNNLELLCRDCHAEVHGFKRKKKTADRFTIGPDGKVIGL